MTPSQQEISARMRIGKRTLMPDEEWMEFCSSQLRSGPGAQHTARQVHCNCSCPSCSGGCTLGKGPDGKLRSPCAVIPHLQAIGPLQCPSLPAALPHAPPASRAGIRKLSQFWEVIFLAHSVAIGHDAFPETRENHFVVIQKEVVSRSLSRDTFATVRSSFLPASCAPSFPSSPPFPLSHSPTPPSAQSAPNPPPLLRLTQK